LGRPADSTAQLLSLTTLLLPPPLFNLPHCSGEDLTPEKQACVQALLEGTVLCNDSALTTDNSSGSTVYTPNGAPTEVALITAALKAGINIDAIKKSTPRVVSVPFESEHKFMATVHAVGPAAGGSQRRVIFVKGAPDRLMPLCNSQLADDDLETIKGGHGSSGVVPLQPGFWQTAQEQLSSQGLRVLAICR
jgi:magnesium-transporting ATPase (P-type)